MSRRAERAEGTVTIPVTPTVRERLKNKSIEMNARNYSEAITRLMDEHDGKKPETGAETSKGG